MRHQREIHAQRRELLKTPAQVSGQAQTPRQGVPQQQWTQLDRTGWCKSRHRDWAERERHVAALVRRSVNRLVMTPSQVARY
jgi:hypothetical protein